MPLEVGDIKLYSIAELSELLKLTKVTLRNYLRNGRINGRKLGKFWYVPEDSLKDYFLGGGAFKDEGRKMV